MNTLFNLAILISMLVNGKNASLIPNQFPAMFGLTVNFLTYSVQANDVDDVILTPEVKHTIDVEIEEYMKIFKKTQDFFSESHSVQKRDSQFNDNFFINDSAGVYIFNGMKNEWNINVKYPKDIVLFNINNGVDNKKYAAALERQYPYEDSPTDLVIYCYDDLIHEISRYDTIGGVKLETFSNDGCQYLVLAQKSMGNPAEYEGSIIYEVDANGNLHAKQYLNTPYASEIAIWTLFDSVYLIICESEQSLEDALTFQVEMPIYRWVQRSFDIMDTITVYNPRQITPFQIENSAYLAVANHQNENGDTETYSEIFKFDLNENTYEPYQKIATHAAVDVKYFHFAVDKERESFLVFANDHVVEDDGTVNSEENSFVYKYVDDYFRPFQSLALHDVSAFYPIHGPNGEFMMIATGKFETSRVFVYDGWRFAEIETPLKADVFGAGVVDVRNYMFESDPSIVVVNAKNDGSVPDVMTPNFAFETVVHNFHDDMDRWTREMAHVLDAQDKQIHRMAEELGVDTQKEDVVIFEQTDSAAAKALGGDSDPIFEAEDIDETPLEDEIADLRKILDSLEHDVENAVIMDAENTLDGSVTFDQLHIVCEDAACVFDNIQTDTVNGINIQSFFENIYNINEPLLADEFLAFEDLIVTNHISPTIINGHSTDSLLYTTEDYVLNEDIFIDGDVRFDNDLFVDKFLGPVQFHENVILLNTGDQFLDGTLDVDSMTTSNLKSPMLNNMVFEAESEAFINTDLFQPKAMKELVAENLVIGEFFNGVLINILDEYALRTHGDQVITANYTFEDLNADQIHTAGFISGVKIPEQLISIRSGKYVVNQDVEFTQNITAADMLVFKQLNQIPVTRGKVGMLLKDVSNVQFISGTKVFENVDLLGPIKLQGRINSERLDKMNPISLISKELVLSGDFTFDGNVTVETFVRSRNMRDSEGVYSLARLRDHGLLLNATIPMDMTFTEPIHVNNLYSKSINDIDPTDWVIMGTNYMQHITGTKHMPQAVHIRGGSSVNVLNGYNLHALDENILKTSGYQVVKGHKTIQIVSAERISCNNTFFGNYNLNEIIENPQPTANINLPNTVKIQNRLSAKNVFVEGDLIGHDTEITPERIVIAEEFSENMIIDKLINVEKINGLDMPEILAFMQQWNEEMIIQGDMQFVNGAAVDRLFFQDSLDGIPSSDFGVNWLMDGKQQIFDTKQIMHTVTSRGNISIDSHMVNGINVQEIAANAVRVDRPETLKNIDFSDGVICKSDVHVGNKVSGLDFENDLMLSNADNVVMTDRISFEQNVIIDGNLIVDNLVSGMNMKRMYEFIYPQNEGEHMNLIISGSATFEEEPLLTVIEDYNLEDLYAQAWYADEDIELSGLFDFETIELDGDNSLNGLMNGFNLSLLNENYWSRTKDQVLSGVIYFEQGVTFGKDLYANQLDVGGLINGINLVEFTKNTLQYNVPQNISSHLHFEDLRVTGHIEMPEQLVNGYNLKTDVLRYDVPEAVVTGTKYIQNVVAYNVHVPSGGRLQNVDMIRWLNESVQKDKPAYLHGSTIIQSPIFLENIQVDGQVNDNIFDEEHIMMKNSSTLQLIRGKKTFSPPNTDPENYFVHFDVLDMKDKLNEIDINHLLQNLAYKTEDCIFHNQMHIPSLTANNIQVENEIFNINIHDIFAMEGVDEMDFLETEYTHLEKKTKEVVANLEEQAYYLAYYNVLETFACSLETIWMLRLKNDYFPHIVITQRDKDEHIITFYTINEDALIPDEGMRPLRMNAQITHLSGVTLQATEYMFVEVPDTVVNDYDALLGHSHHATLFALAADGHGVVPARVLPTNGTKCLTSFHLAVEQRDCMLLLGYNTSLANVYCDGEQQANQLYLHQQIPTIDASDAVMVEIEGNAYLIITNKGDQKYEASVDVWRYDGNLHTFVRHQMIHVANPNSVDAIQYKHQHYLAIASSHVQDAIDSGLIDIRRFDPVSKSFVTWPVNQNLHSRAPFSVHFAQLPSEELVLYVLTDNPTEPLLVYLYQGVSGFVSKITASTIPTGVGMQHFNTWDNKHYVIVRTEDEARLIQAIFKGSR